MDDEVPESISDLMPITVDVDTPKTEDMPVRAQQVLCLRACGFSPASIARLCGVTPSAITQYISRYDPLGKVTLSQKERRRFLSSLWEARAGEALLHITPEKMELSDAKQLAGIASLASKHMKLLQQDEQEDDRDPMKIIDALAS